MTSQSWIQWFVASISAGATIVIFAFTTFISRSEGESLSKTIEQVNARVSNMEQRVDRKLEKIDEKLDRIIEQKNR